MLERQDWPGNVRELRNVLAYAYAVGDGPILQPGDLPPELLDVALAGAPAPGEARTEPPLSKEAQALLDALRRTGGNKTRAAQLAGHESGHALAPHARARHRERASGRLDQALTQELR